MTTTSNGTRLSAHGPRVDDLLNTAPTVTPTAPATPTPTIRTMTICVPDELPTPVLNSTRQLDRHFGVQATTARRFWATQKLHRWQHHHLIDLHTARHQPAYCAGGPVRLLDIEGLRHAAGMAAGIRHQLWAHAVRGTRDAAPWRLYVQRHLDDPAKYPMAKAHADFGNQPRVNAMRMHNAAVPGAALDPNELEMLQNGQMAYQHYHALLAVCADALLTQAGTRVQPTTDAMADKVTYLHTAMRHIEGLDATVRLLAITL